MAHYSRFRERFSIVTTDVSKFSAGSLAATFDGRTARCYVDGVESSRPVRNGPLKETPWDLCIGNSVVGYGTGELLAFDGLIDEVRIYNRAP